MPSARFLRRSTVVSASGLQFKANYLNPATLRVHRHKDGGLLLTIKDVVTYIDVTCHLSFPISEPERYVEFRDRGGKVIGTVERLKDLDGESQRVIREELERSYFIPRIVSVEEIVEDAGALRFVTDTDRGRVTFYVLHQHEDITRLPDGRLRLKDGFGNMYEILPWRLDATSAAKIEKIT